MGQFPFMKNDLPPYDLIHGDVLDSLYALPGASVDLVVSSPPYNIGKSYEQKSSMTEYLAWQKAVIEQLYRVLKPTGSVMWQVGNHVSNGEVIPLDVPFWQIFSETGMRLRNRIIWHFGHGLHAKRRFSGRYETISWFSKTSDYASNLNAPAPKGIPTSIWEGLIREWDEGIFKITNVKHNHPEKTAHPCQFPVELAERCVLAASNPGDVVLDPFGGTGSTAIAALRHGRRATLIERDEAYLNIAAQRIQSLADGTLKIRPIGGAKARRA